MQQAALLCAALQQAPGKKLLGLGFTVGFRVGKSLGLGAALLLIVF